MQRTLNTVTTAAALALAATATYAEPQWGANFGLEYFDNRDWDTSVNSLYGQGNYSFGNFGLQLDIAANKYDFYDDRELNLGLHAYYDTGMNWKLGGYLGRQKWFGNDWDYYGLETAYTSNRFRVDAHIGKFEYSGFDYTLFGIDTSYDLFGDPYDGPASSADPSWGPSSSFSGPPVTLNFGLHGVRDTGFDENLIYVGATASLFNDFKIDLTAARVAEQNQFGIALRKELGGGVPFHLRGWTSAFKAW